MIRETKEWLELLEEGIRMWITLKEKCQDGRQDYDKTEYFKDNPGSLLEHAESRCALCETCDRLGLVGCQGCPNNWGDGCGAFDCAIPEMGIEFSWVDKHTPEAAEFIIQSHKILMDRLRERGE